MYSAADEQTGMERLVQAMQSYGIWDDALAPRISIVPGDISRYASPLSSISLASLITSYSRFTVSTSFHHSDLLGVSPSVWESLTREIDTIVHSGAQVHWLQSFQQLRAPNVGGTQEVLRLACQYRLKQVHYVSTTNVFDTLHHSKLDVVYEHDEAAHDEGLTGGYTQTKWVAEQLVKRARSRGIPTHILRPGYVTGDAETGVSNVDDFLCRLLKGCVELKAAPIMDKAAIDMSSGIFLF